MVHNKSVLNKTVLNKIMVDKAIELTVAADGEVF